MNTRLRWRSCVEPGPTPNLRGKRIQLPWIQVGRLIRTTKNPGPSPLTRFETSKEISMGLASKRHRCGVSCSSGPAAGTPNVRIHASALSNISSLPCSQQFSVSIRCVEVHQQPRTPCVSSKHLISSSGTSTRGTHTSKSARVSTSSWPSERSYLMSTCYRTPGAGAVESSVSTESKGREGVRTAAARHLSDVNRL